MGGMDERDDDLDRAARMLAAAYWRGRWEEARGVKDNHGEEVEDWIRRVSENDAPRWLAAARVLLPIRKATVDSQR